MEDRAVLPVISLTQSLTTRVEDTRALRIATSGRVSALMGKLSVVEIGVRARRIDQLRVGHPWY
jgi:hypothetical protein